MSDFHIKYSAKTSYLSLKHLKEGGMTSFFTSTYYISSWVTITETFKGSLRS